MRWTCLAPAAFLIASAVAQSCTTISSRDAVLIIDVQNDFLETRPVQPGVFCSVVGCLWATSLPAARHLLFRTY
jgi:hypothetical protein